MNMGLYEVVIGSTKSANKYLDIIFKVIEEKDAELAEEIARDIDNVKYYIDSIEGATRYCAKLENGKE